MAYRKIIIDGKTYEYTVGKKFTKIKGFKKPILNEEIGHKTSIFKEETNIEINQEDLTQEDLKEFRKFAKIAVKPKDITKYIKEVNQNESL